MEPNAIEKIISRVMRVFLALAGAVLALMMFLTATDVALRYIFNRPIPGALELTEYMMGILVPFAAAYCAHEKSHVAVEFIFERLPKFLQKCLHTVTSLATAVFIGVITWQNVLYIHETYLSKMTSAVLRVPAYPFVAAVAAGCALFCIILTYGFFKDLRT